MTKYLSIEEAANYLAVTEETIKRYVELGQLPTYKLDRALRFKTDDLDNLLTYGVTLAPRVRAVVSHIAPVKEGVEAWRVIIKVHDVSSKVGGVIPFGGEVKKTEYVVWVTAEYLEDVAKFPGDIRGAEKFALKWIRDRFEETKDQNGDRSIERITENGVRCEQGRCEKLVS